MTSATPELVVPDTSCLIALVALGQIDLLRAFYGTVFVPEAVADEFGDSLPPWLESRRVTNTKLVAALHTSLGAGESEVIALATEVEGALVILDDLRARRVAADMGLRLTGTLGIILRAKKEGVLASVATALAQVESVGFRLSPALRAEALRLAGETAS